MTRAETALNIAIINRDSKILTMGCKLEDSGIIRGVFRDNPDYEELADGIMDYIRSDRDVALYGQLMHLVDTVPIRVFLENNKHSSLYGQILEVADVVDRLITFGYQMYEKGSDEFEHLIPFFANEKAEELLKRAANAGLLTPGYRPQPSTQRFQLKLIAICMIEIMGLGHGDKWNHFEELWGTSISRCGIPLTKGLAISKVATLYPEVNLWEIIAPKNNKMVLKTDLTEEQARKLFKGLVHYGFLGPRTAPESFLAIMGLSDFPFHQVNWIGKGMNSLLYFVKEVFGESNSDIHRKTCDCFTVNGQALKYQTLKSRSSYVFRNKSKFDFILILNKIIASARKK